MCEASRETHAAKKQKPDEEAVSEDEDEDDDDDDDDDDEDDYGFADAGDEPTADGDGNGGNQQPDPTSAADSARDMAMEKDLAKAFAQGGSSAATMVITKEYMRLLKQQQRGSSDGLAVSMPDEANGYRWMVAVTPPEDTPLHQELVAYSSKHEQPAEIQLEMLFSSDFPMSPPFVRVLRPRFAFHTGHVTIGGSICIELLTSSGWSPAYTIESLLVQVRSLFVVGEARLDPASAHVPYGEQEAREAFRRVAQQHGWRTSI